MYPIDRRKLAQHIYSLFNSLRKTAIVLQVSHSTVHRLVVRWCLLFFLYEKQEYASFCSSREHHSPRV